jgi:hypothetical protein
MELISLDCRETLRFAPYVPERIGQDVFVRHELVECSQIVTLKSVAPVRLHAPDRIFIGVRRIL